MFILLLNPWIQLSRRLVSHIGFPSLVLMAFTECSRFISLKLDSVSEADAPQQLLPLPDSLPVDPDQDMKE